MNQWKIKIFSLIFLNFFFIWIFYFLLTNSNSNKQNIKEKICTLPTEKNKEEKYLIPSIIHQTWKNTTIPEHWKEAVNSWKNLTTFNFTYYLWTDEKNREFLKENFPWFLKTYDSYPYHIQRVDSIRLFLLYKYGGIYADMDIGRKKSSSINDFRSFEVFIYNILLLNRYRLYYLKHNQLVFLMI